MKYIVSLILFFYFLLILLISLPLEAQNPNQNKQLKQEEISKYLKEWLNSPIRYIITKEESDAYKKLKDKKEKLRFINYFWMRRDPNLKTIVNDFRDEFYKKVAGSNQYFKSGKKEGWKTDRGRIYIILGPPNDKETGITRSDSGSIKSSMQRYEIWTYYSLPSNKIPSEYSITFIDWYGNKDYMLDSGNYHGKGFLELDMDKRFYMARSGYMPQELGAAIEDIIEQSIVNKDLKFADIPVPVKTDRKLPFKFYRTPFRANVSETQLLLGITFRYSDVIFKEKDKGKLCPSLVIEALLLDKKKKRVDSFKQNLVFSIEAQELEKKLYDNFLIWQNLQAKPGKYILNIKAEDKNSGTCSVWNKEINIPSLRGKEPILSKVIFADEIVPSTQIQADKTAINTIQLMEYQITPNLHSAYQSNSNLCFFFQLINLQLDKKSLKPIVEVNCSILKDYKTVETFKLADSSFTSRESDELLAFFCLPLTEYVAGEYTLAIRAVDKIANKNISRQLKFRVFDKLP